MSGLSKRMKQACKEDCLLVFQIKVTKPESKVHNKTNLQQLNVSTSKQTESGEIKVY